MAIRVKAISDRVDLDSDPPEMYVLLTLTDGSTEVDLPLGPDAHNALFQAFPGMLSSARNVTAPATTAPVAPVVEAPPEVVEDLPQVIPIADDLLPVDDSLPGSSSWTPATPSQPSEED